MISQLLRLIPSLPGIVGQANLEARCLVHPYIMCYRSDLSGLLRTCSDFAGRREGE